MHMMTVVNTFYLHDSYWHKVRYHLKMMSMLTLVTQMKSIPSNSQNINGINYKPEQLHDSSNLQSYFCTYIEKRRHRQLKIVGKIFGICLNLSGKFILLLRKAKIDEGVNITYFGERHFHSNINCRLLSIACHRLRSDIHC